MAGRRLGQHFLVRRGYLERIAAAACPQKEPLVVEIGPGRGALTEHLLGRAERLIAVEIDASLSGSLRGRFPGLTVVEADVLETDLAHWGQAVFAGNLPYYITSPILTRLFALGPLMKRGVVLVQREVADRIAAQPGSRDYGYLTVQANLYTTPEVLFRVPPSAFSPPPTVESAVVRFTPVPLARWDVDRPGEFLEFVGRCFRHKRKTLRNNLLPFYSRDLVEALPEAGLRAEQLSMEQFVGLWRRLY